MIRFEHIFFRRGDREILHDVHFEIRPEENWMILGRNGSGKTTILEMMNGYLFPSSGKIEVLGHTYGQVDIREIRKRIGYISQSLMEKLTLRDPVWEVVAAGMFGFLRFYEEVPREAREMAYALLEQVGIRHTAEQPLGSLSQGERKKAMLARSLMTNPQILVMDEPCAGLDLYEREKFLEDLDLLKKKGIGLIYVTHHIEEIVPVFSHIMLIHEGRVLAQGPKKEVLTPAWIEQAYDVRVELEWVRDRAWIKVVSD